MRVSQADHSHPHIYFLIVVLYFVFAITNLQTNLSLKKGLNFVHINCRSLFNKLPQVTLLFAKYNIICCSETWLSKDFSDAFIEIRGKKVFRSDRNGRGGGVCIYIDSKLAPYCEIATNFTYSNRDLEIVSVYLKKPGLRHMLISSIYRPPRGSIKSCTDHLQDIFASRLNSKTEIWLLGDFNVDFLDRTQPNRGIFLDLFKKNGCKQLISDITRPGRYKSSCLDWIVTNCCFINDACSLDTMISDHYAVSAVRKKRRENVTYVYREIRDYSNYIPKNFTDLLRLKLGQSNYYDIRDPNILWELIAKFTCEILEVMCPLRRYKQRENLTPWMVADIYREMRYRDRLAKLFRATRSNESLCALRRQRNIVNSRIDTAKKNYIQRILNENSKNPKKFWKIINELLNGRRTSNEYAQFIDPTTNEPIQFGAEAEFLNSYFCNIIDRLDIDENIDVNHYQQIDSDLDELYGHIESTLDLTDDLVTVGELEFIVSNMDVSKGSSIPGISTFVCRDIMK